MIKQDNVSNIPIADKLPFGVSVTLRRDSTSCYKLPFGLVCFLDWIGLGIGLRGIIGGIIMEGIG